MGYYFGICFGFEGDALFNKFCLETGVVLDDAVMNDGNLAIKADVGVGILFCGGSVGGPAGVCDADVALYGGFLELRFQGANFTGCADGGDFPVVDKGDSRTVVSSVFQFLQTAHKNGKSFALTDVGDYSAHKNPRKSRFS